jgi:phage tail sheath protein FI
MNGIWTSLVALEKELDTEIAGAYTPVFSALAPALGATWTAHAGVAASTQITGLTDIARLNEGFTIAKNLFEQAATAFSEVLDAIYNLSSTLESALLESFPLYKNIIQGLNDSATEMPPSGAVVGVYAATDRDRGVWKAPANVSLASVVGPNTVFTASQLDALNIDVNAGKSINAIRSFVGKGTLIWGARTLAGNDNEWRYVPVRRFFNTVEESIKKSTYWAVFEPNNGNTWVKVKGMIENYLTNKWKEGALVGAKPDEAFFVRIGLGTTMSAQDILEGYMKVEIGMAVVRPAEFIVLKFSHKLQQS